MYTGMHELAVATFNKVIVALYSLPYVANRTNSISDFVVTFSDEKGKQHRCLACQQIMPAPARSIVSHIERSQEDNYWEYNFCHRVTRWMIQHLAYVKGEKETDIQDLSAASSGTQSRKRKAPPLLLPPTVPDLDQQSVVIPVGLSFQIWTVLSATSLKAIWALLNDKSQSAAVSKAKERAFRQEGLITELIEIVFEFFG